jgi:hypothetical protein
VARRTKNTAKNRILSSDKYYEGYEDDDGVHSGHQKGVNVVNTDGSGAFLEVDKLEKDTGLPTGVVR